MTLLCQRQAALAMRHASAVPRLALALPMPSVRRLHALAAARPTRQATSSWHLATSVRFMTTPATPTPTPATPAATSTASSSADPSAASAPPPPGGSWTTGGSKGDAGGRSGRSRSDKSQGARLVSSNANMLQYLLGVAILVVGASWAAVPLYRAFCAHTGYGGTTQTDKDGSKLATLTPSKKEVTVMFNADVSPAMHWQFVPSQSQLKIKLGEPVLAFYKATNLRDKPITGVATYNVTPMKAGLYFHKIQCFCFDEQRLRANETVDMPVFFYIDPAMETDSRTSDVTHLTLSYTFFPVEDDEDDTRSEEEKHAAALAVRIHGTGLMPDGSPVTAAALAAANAAAAKATSAATTAATSTPVNPPK